MISFPCRYYTKRLKCTHSIKLTQHNRLCYQKSNQRHNSLLHGDSRCPKQYSGGSQPLTISKNYLSSLHTFLSRELEGPRVLRFPPTAFSTDDSPPTNPALSLLQHLCSGENAQQRNGMVLAGSKKEQKEQDRQ